MHAHMHTSTDVIPVARIKNAYTDTQQTGQKVKVKHKAAPHHWTVATLTLQHAVAVSFPQTQQKQGDKCTKQKYTPKLHGGI